MKTKTRQVQWMSIKSDTDGALLVFIRRDFVHLRVTGLPTPAYIPSPASEKRVLKVAEDLAGKYEISLHFSKLVGKLNMLILLNLPRKHEVLESS